MSVTLIVSDRIARQLQRLQWAKGDKTEDKLAKLIDWTFDIANLSPT